MRIVLQGEVPAKKNSRIALKNGRNIPSARYREWHEAAALQVMAQCRVAKPIDRPCEVRVLFVHGDMRRRDGDNGLSSVMDLLVDCGVLADDCWTIARRLVVENAYEKGKPKAVVEIEPLKTE